MRGWLIVNGFLNAEKYRELYSLLENAAKKRNITLEIQTNDALLHDVALDKTTPDLPDFALFWDKDICLAKRLELLGVRLFNSAKAVEICDNKILTAIALNAAGVPMPKTVPAPKTFENVGYKNLAFVENAAKILGYPMVLKEAYGSFGAQVYLAQNREEAFAIVQKIGHKEFLMQEFIATSRGKDIRVNVVGGEVVSAMLRVNDHDFRSNVTGGGKPQKTEITAAQAQAAIGACKAIGLDFAGVDILFGENGTPLVCEVNSNPHFKSTLDCTGKDLSEEILGYIMGQI